jgi:hypothetical protein
MWYNFVFINIYCLIVNKLKNISLLNKESYSSEEEVLVADLENLRLTFLSRLEQYLKFQIKKRGISLIQNTYTGFDTEIEEDESQKNKNKFKNNLISVQTAVQRRTIMKLPLYHPYDISYLHPLSS